MHMIYARKCTGSLLRILLPRKPVLHNKTLPTGYEADALSL